MTVTSRVPALIDYLYNLFAGDSTLGGPIVNGVQTGAVTVYDGPPTTAADPGLKLYVGLADPDNPGNDPAADFTQAWASLGRRGRDEQVIIHCCAETWGGNDDIRTARVAVYGIVSAVETLMQADTTQFGGNALFPDPGFTTGALLQNNTTTGALVRVQFDLIFKSRVGG